MPLLKGSSKKVASITDLAYIAGFFDGEGCVNFGKVRGAIFIRVMIVNTNKEPLEFIQDRFGGDIKHRKQIKDWKRAYIWRISWSRAIAFLEAIQPFVIIKRDQIVLAYCWDHFRLGRGKRNMEDKQANREANEYMAECLTFFNKKGQHDLEDPVARALCPS